MLFLRSTISSQIPMKMPTNSISVIDYMVLNENKYAKDIANCTKWNVFVKVVKSVLPHLHKQKAPKQSRFIF